VKKADAPAPKEAKGAKGKVAKPAASKPKAGGKK
jgi:hypothetical protein